MKAKAVEIDAITEAAGEDYYIPTLKTFEGYAKSPTTFVDEVPI